MNGVAQEAQPAPSTLHSKVAGVSVAVNSKSGVASLFGSAGLTVIDVSGGPTTLSTTTLRVTTVVLPTLSVAVARNVFGPSETELVSQPTLYGAAVSAEPIGVNGPPSETSKSTEATPAPPTSVAVAVTACVFESSIAPAPGAVKAVAGPVESAVSVKLPFAVLVARSCAVTVCAPEAVAPALHV